MILNQQIDREVEANHEHCNKKPISFIYKLNKIYGNKKNWST